jgi:8-oxo-dGTP pyrophosphatase MutT (NUDIX family)
MVGITLEEIARKLTFYVPRLIEDKNSKRAAVIVPLYSDKGGMWILLTKRTYEVSLHKGEISFPGGACEPSDPDLKEAAVRECFEEIGVRPSDLKILGRLDDTYTLTGYLLSAYVGAIISQVSFKINPKEVASIIFLPMKCILNKDFQREEGAFFYKGEKIFGATFRILKNLSSLLVSD